MHHSSTGQCAPRHYTFTLKASVASLLATGLLTGASVWAQDQPTVTPDSNVVQVTGVRKAAQSAQTIKRNADEVLDSIVAEEAGKFPDKNVAEVLGRVSGVQIRREFGEASSVIVRGLPGLVTLLNGREVYTANGRSLYLADIPTTMLQRVDVYKTQSADMVEGGTAGVIDVRTSRPFDFKGFTANINGRVEHRDKSKADDPQLSGMVSNRWKTGIGEIGVLAGLSFQKGTYHDEVTWNSPPDKTVTSDPNITGPYDLGHVNYTGIRNRWAGNWAVQWRPNRDVEVYAEGWSTRIDHDAERQFFVGHQGWLAQPWTASGDIDWGNALRTNPTYTLFPGTNQIATISATRPAGNYHFFTLSSNQTPQDDSTGHQGAVGARWNVTPELRVTSELARTYTHWEQSLPIMELLADPPAVTGKTYVNGGAWFDYPGYNMMDPKNYRMGAFLDLWQASRGASNDWRADATYNNGDESFFREFSAGVRVAKRTSSYMHESNGFMGPRFGMPDIGSVPGMACPSMPLANDYGMNQWLVVCADYQHANLDATRKLYGRSGKSDPDPFSLYNNQEDTRAFYGKTRFGFQAGAIPVEGTAGVRLVRTELDVNGFSNVNNTPVAANRKSSDTDVLPNLTMKALLSKDWIARFNAGKAIQRPDFGAFNPGQFVSSAPDTLGVYDGNGGNPDLKPIVGKNYDASLEWYFAPTGSITATAFKHKFENYVINKLAMETIDGKQVRMTRPRNVNDGELKGVELAYRQFYDFLPGWLSGFGTELNYTYMKGYLEDEGKRNPFVGMSKNAYNIVALYERGPWSGRLAYNYRGKFVDAYNYRALGFDLIVDPIETADASVSYRINENMGVTFDVENLLDRTYHDYHGIPSNPRDIRRYDRVFGLTLRWRM
ncbi:TonB-dependent receptor [Duganella radicis]|uniref:TonB-dependent receptor n=1 Tax=Duganella radicis TaxID=551988 RepID=A0A6L6PL57_9BURK|nr:TonB-dependent receptor [Duganella radicis]MTV39830.1 TonB-dependent receptor [Duganella radicis]